jgi:putative tricarboxylic transport membrane protein
MLEAWVDGFTSLLGLHELAFLTVGVAVGLFVGVLPGLGGAATLALLTPLTYGMTPIEAFALAGGIMGSVPMGGAVTAILLNTPGQPANVVTCLDGYPLAQQGKAGLAIGAAASANAFGGLIGAITVLGVLPLARPLVELVGPPELFLLASLGLVMVSTLSRGLLLRSLITACIGLMLAGVGYSDVTGTDRFTFGSDYLWDGVHFAPALIGLYAVAEMIELMVKGGAVVNNDLPVRVSGVTDGLMETFRHPGALLRGSLIGTIVGAIPGIGGAVASFISYGVAARTSKHPETFGKGNVEGIIAPEAAVNAKDGSMLIPTLALGIPGGAEMAVFMGILILHGMQPGPAMLVDHQAEIYGLIWALTASCFAASALGLLLSRPLAKLTRVDAQLLAPIVITLSFAGSYAIDQAPENMIVTLVFALLGYAMMRLRFPRLALVIAMVLGGIAERSFHQSMMMSGGEWSVFISRPQCAVLLVLIVVALAGPGLAGFSRSVLLRVPRRNR